MTIFISYIYTDEVDFYPSQGIFFDAVALVTGNTTILTNFNRVD